MLERLGYRVIVASNGTDAVQLFTSDPGRFDLLILDVVMPKVSGPAAFSQMAAVRHDLRVVFSTGYTAEAASLNSLTAQGAEVLQKPYSLKNLGQTVRASLDRPRTTFVPTAVSDVHR